jgi:hypothetical protein
MKKPRTLAVLGFFMRNRWKLPVEVAHRLPVGKHEGYCSTGIVISWPTWILFGSEILLAVAMLV